MEYKHQVWLRVLIKDGFTSIHLNVLFWLNDGLITIQDSYLKYALGIGWNRVLLQMMGRQKEKELLNYFWILLRWLFLGDQTWATNLISDSNFDMRHYWCVWYASSFNHRIVLKFLSWSVFILWHWHNFSTDWSNYTLNLMLDSTILTMYKYVHFTILFHFLTEIVCH